MSQKDKDIIEEQDIIEEMEEEIEEIENEDGEIDEEKLEEELHPEVQESALKSQLAKTMADFENFKKRTERDKVDTMFFLKSKILKEMLPTIDDLDRIIKNTKEENKDTPLYEGVISSFKKLEKTFESLGAKKFDSIGEGVNPDLHDVMSLVPGNEPGIIFDEFEKGYMLDGKVLRHAKVVVGADV